MMSCFLSQSAIPSLAYHLYLNRQGVLLYMSESTLQLEPPRYSPSLPSPDYSVKPADGEHLIDHGLGGTPVANSTFIKKFGRTTVVLNEQEEGTTTPTFGRHADISGHLFFEQGHDILDVTLKVNFGVIF